LLLSLLVVGLFIPGWWPVVKAQTVAAPNTLSHGSVANAEGMGGNFDAVCTGVDLGRPNFGSACCVGNAGTLAASTEWSAGEEASNAPGITSVRISD
jgi:hypothetical protein